MIERATSYKLGILEIMNGNWKGEGLHINGMEIKRARVMGTVVQKYVSDDKNYGFLVLDDETETIRIKAFKEEMSLIEGISAGDFAEVIGKVRKYNEEVYISPAIVVRIDNPNTYFLRKIELMKGFSPQKNLEVVEDYFADDKKKGEILHLMKELDKGDGASFDKISEEIKMDKKDVEMVLYALLKDGQIYEPRQRRYRVL
jgi:DNA replicative helicase MCM subunit Mcm2 (Cdc46/Mcm family)